MLRSVKNLEGYAIGGTDGEIGHAKDFYFDDRAWVVRYLVVDAGTYHAQRGYWADDPLLDTEPSRVE